MESEEKQAEIEHLDQCAVALYLEVPGSKVVLFQAFFDLYEAIGVVRTVDIRLSQICIVTTSDMLLDCVAVLHALRREIPWRFMKKPADSEKLFGYSKKNRQYEARNE